jgi:ribosomal protein S18 acetylase RimI-like enzyme
MLSACETVCRKLVPEVTNMSLHVHVSNHPARELYSSAGFAAEGDQPAKLRLFRTGPKHYMMVKWL